MSEPIKMLGEFIEYQEKTFYDKLFYEITYKQPNGVKPDKEWKHQAADSELSEAALDLLISANAGDRFCFHQGKNDKGFPVIVDITDAKDAPTKTEQKSKYNNKDWKSKDETGVAVGAAWTNAIEIVKLYQWQDDWESLDAPLEDISKLVEKILKLKLEQEDKLRASKKEKEREQEEKPLSRAEQLKAKKKVTKTVSAKKEEPKDQEVKEPELETVDEFFGTPGGE